MDNSSNFTGGLKLCLSERDASPKFWYRKISKAERGNDRETSINRSATSVSQSRTSIIWQIKPRWVMTRNQKRSSKRTIESPSRVFCCLCLPNERNEVLLLFSIMVQSVNRSNESGAALAGDVTKGEKVLFAWRLLLATVLLLPFFVLKGGRCCCCRCRISRIRRRAR